jgi:hypothetical protein
VFTVTIAITATFTHGHATRTYTDSSFFPRAGIALQIPTTAATATAYLIIACSHECVTLEPIPCYDERSERAGKQLTPASFQNFWM